MSAKRALFTTPSRASKRRRTAAPRRQKPMRIPKALLPEMKQYTKSSLSASSTSYAYSSIPSDMGQGDDGDDFIGSNFRIARIRVYYDFSQISLTSGVRMALVIPKDPSTTSVNAILSTTTPVDKTNFTILFDRLLPDSVDVAAGYFDWSGPLNVEMNKTGTTTLRNNVHLHVYASGVGASMANAFAYAVWFTDN